MFQNRIEFVELILTMPIYKKIIYGIAVLIYLFYYITFWSVEFFSGMHLTYEYININKEILIQRNDILYSLILMMININISSIILSILSFILIIKSMFFQPFLYHFTLAWEE
jgi:hypothetical protein